MRASLLLLALSACAGSPNASVAEDGDGDADAGTNPVTEVERDAGLGGDDACVELVAVTCGETCGESPACAAAQLMRDHEPERCAEALVDTQTYPVCLLGSCDALVDKACGGEPPLPSCADAPGCPPALSLKARAADPDASQQETDEAKASCLQALEDDVVFAACPQ